jgi:hypothetical protein
MPAELSPNVVSPTRPRSATTTDIPHTFTQTPVITAIPPSPASIHASDFALPPLAPLNLAVLTEEPGPGNGAGKLLMEEMERILTGFAGILDVVGNGLTALESNSRPMDAGPKAVNEDYDFGGSSEGGRDRLDSLTSSFTSGGTIIKR